MTVKRIERIVTRSELACAICHAPGPDLDIDHIKNRGAGGSKARDVPENKIALCRTCHELKTMNKITTWADTSLAQWYYYWRRVDLLAKESPPTIRVPVKVDERHGCLVYTGEGLSAFEDTGPQPRVPMPIPFDGAEPISDVSGLELEECSAPSKAGERNGEGQRVASDSHAPPSPAHGAGDGPHSVVDTAGGTPSPALPMNAEEESQPSEGSPAHAVRPRASIAVRRPSSAFSLESDWASLDDETLQQIYEEGEHRQQEGYLLKCHAVWQYRENHVQAWGESWTDQAIERFGCSRPYTFAYANLWEIYLTIDTTLREGMASLTDSRSLMQMIGRKRLEDGVKVLEAAVAHVAEFGQPPSLAGLLRGAEQPERERHTCSCGNVHWLVVEGEWKG